MNSLHSNIKFTIEHPTDNNSLSLLDFSIRLENGIACYNYFQKSAKRLLFVNYHSAIPIEQKLNIAKNELQRRLVRCSNIEDKQKCRDDLYKILKLNDYPDHFLQTHLPRIPGRTNKPKNQFYFQIPFISDSVNNQLKRIFRGVNLPVRISHRSFTLRMALNQRHRHDNIKCDLRSCQLNNNLCLRTNVIYQIKCNSCSKIYIGSTIRSLHVRLKEHLTRKESSVFRHKQLCSPKDIFPFEISILASDNDNINLRLREAMYIKKLRPDLNNREECNEYQSLLF